MKIQKTVLKNGLNLVLVPRTESLSATIMIMVATGSDYESAAEDGLAHFLEHMCFKGTTKRPGPADISTELDSLGANYNAFTSNEYTGYYATVESRHTAQAFDVVADIYLNSKFDEQELTKEKGVIIEEINMYEDMPARQVHNYLAQLLYGNQPAGRPITGTKETVSKLTRQAMQNYWRKHYVPSATTVAVVGNFNQAEIKKLVKKYFGSLPARAKTKKPKVIEKQTKPATLIKFKKSDQAHLLFAFRSKSLKHKDSYALTVLATILGGGMSFRLFKKIRDELGAAYYVWADNDQSTDHGAFVIGVGADTKRAKLITETILQECRKLKEQEVSAEELKRAKDYLTGKLALRMESNSAIASFFTIQNVLEQKWDTPNEAVQKIRAVKAKDLQRLAREIFRNEKLNLAAIGPYQTDKAFVEVLQV